MGDQLSLLSFYLGLFTILITVFFVRLDTWHGEALALNRQWERVGRGKKLKDLNAALLDDIRLRANGISGACPWRGFSLVCIFLAVLAVLAFMLRTTVEPTEVPFSLNVYIYLPGGIFLGAFVLGSLTFMIHGRKLVSAVLNEMGK